jgi:hypothetical protein
MGNERKMVVQSVKATSFLGIAAMPINLREKFGSWSNMIDSSKIQTPVSETVVKVENTNFQQLQGNLKLIVTNTMTTAIHRHPYLTARIKNS